MITSARACGSSIDVADLEQPVVAPQLEPARGAARGRGWRR